MPYIEKDDRALYDKEIKSLIHKVSEQEEQQQKYKPGDLNYIISKLLATYVESREASYANYNTCIGVLESAKLELYRTSIADYEDKARKKNGVV